jgi:hypothetical protein
MDSKMNNWDIIRRLLPPESLAAVNTHEREQKLEGRYLPNVGHLLVVTQKSPSPYQALAMYTGASRADPFYFLLNITDSSDRGNRNLKRMRIGGQLDADDKGHEK